MPVLRGSVTFARFRVQPPEKGSSDARRWLQRGLTAHAFEPIDRRGDEDRAAGFVELENPDGAEFAVSALFYGERALFGWRVDTLKVSAQAVRDELQRWAAAFEREHDRKPVRAEKRDAKGAVRQKLRSQASVTTKVHDVAWNLEAEQLQIWASSRKLIEEISAALEETFKVKLVPLIPGALALESGVDEAALIPTADLLGAGFEEVANGQA